MANAYASKLKKEAPNMNSSKTLNEGRIESLDFIVKGMTCSHCKASVESSIKSIDDKIETFVNLSTGRVSIKGLSIDKLKVKEKIESRGFTVEF